MPRTGSARWPQAGPPETDRARNRPRGRRGYRPLTGRLRDRPAPGVLARRSVTVDARGCSARTSEGWSMPEKDPEVGPNPTRRGVLLGAVGLVGLGATLAGCSTAAVPYDADEAGVPPQPGPAPSARAMNPSAPAASAGGTSGGGPQDGSTPKKSPAARGVVLGGAGEIP